MNASADALLSASRDAIAACDRLAFPPKVHTVYNPLKYAWAMHEDYVRRYASGDKRVVFMGMNPGPWGMAQTGLPFGEVAAVRDWLGVRGKVSRPADEHPKRPITGLDCPRSEVSGRRLWALFQERFENPEAFFREHFVVNYCPLAFLEETGRNFTPDKLAKAYRQPLLDACDDYLRARVDALGAEIVVGVGRFARLAAERALGQNVKVVEVLHPSPASPRANRGWAEQAIVQLVEAGVWSAQP